jgi:thiol-disulfide isomerase/thioredoxin
MSATKTKVQSIIDENPVAVFSKSYCPYCRQAKELLSQSGAKFYAIELDQVGTYTSEFELARTTSSTIEGGCVWMEKCWESHEGQLFEALDIG